VMGVQYFNCLPGRGIFLLPGQIRASGSDDEAVEARGSGHVETAARKTADGRLWLGDDVSWKGRRGTVRYIGKVDFAAGEWVGVELSEATGMHDGNVNGVQYFSCPAQMGVFLLPGQVHTVGATEAVLVGSAGGRQTEVAGRKRRSMGCTLM